MKIFSYGNTDLGRMRRRNEDAFLNEPESRLFAVADGLGGLSAGDRASQMAISILKAHQHEALKEDRPLDFRQVFTDAHRAIQKMGSQADPVRGAGTTLTVALFLDDELLIAHAGDSAAYLFLRDSWKQLTTDHTEAEEFRKLRPGEKPPAIFEHTLTRCLGQPGNLEPDLFRHPFGAGDRLLLCTDGVTRGIKPEEIAAWTQDHPKPKGLVDQILQLANRRGGSDNATAVSIYINES